MNCDEQRSSRQGHSRAIWLKVCITCDTHAPSRCSEERPGEALARAIEALLSNSALGELLALRRVPCLSGCKVPCNIVLGAADKTKIRLNHLDVSQAADILKLAHMYVASEDGDVEQHDWPKTLRGCLAARIEPFREAGREARIDT